MVAQSDRRGEVIVMSEQDVKGLFDVAHMRDVKALRRRWTPVCS
jgi:hypothetical protein